MHSLDTSLRQSYSSISNDAFIYAWTCASMPSEDAGRRYTMNKTAEVLEIACWFRSISRLTDSIAHTTNCRWYRTRAPRACTTFRELKIHTLSRALPTVCHCPRVDELVPCLFVFLLPRAAYLHRSVPPGTEVFVITNNVPSTDGSGVFFVHVCEVLACVDRPKSFARLRTYRHSPR